MIIKRSISCSIHIQSKAAERKERTHETTRKGSRSGEEKKERQRALKQRDKRDGIGSGTLAIKHEDCDCFRIKKTVEM